MTAYYNEIDPFAADWLRKLIREGVIPPGDVDERSVEDVRPADLAGYRQCHFFCGIGIWPAALRLAGWPDDRPVWTGSCPCQPFSTAGKGEGFADERHLWPAWFHLIGVCKPPVVIGEQVAGKDGGTWLDLVHADLESMGYACGPVVAPAAGFGAPQGRHRIYFVAESERGRFEAGRSSFPGGEGGETFVEQRGESVVLAYATDSHGRAGERGAETGTRVVGKPDSPGSQPWRERGETLGYGDTIVATGGPIRPEYPIEPGLEGHAGNEQDGHEPGRQRTDEARPVAEAGGTDGMADAEHAERGTLSIHGENERDRDDAGREEAHGIAGTRGEVRGPCNGFWHDALWIPCRDGKRRPVEPGTFPLASGLPRSMGSMQPELRRLAEMAGLHGRSLKRARGNRTGRLKGYGNCINLPQAEAFIEAYMDSTR
jgi:DNA (cytosine-5)-methyltransferase 1